MVQDIHEKVEQEALSKLGLTLEEALKDNSRFLHPSDREIISMANRANNLIQSKTIDANEWEMLVEDHKRFATEVLISDIFPDQIKDFIRNMVKNILTSIEGFKEVKDKIFSIIDNEEGVVFEKYTFKDEKQYYDKLYSIRSFCIHYLALRESLNK